jgi:Tfp pilus assembly protein PilO
VGELGARERLIVCVVVAVAAVLAAWFLLLSPERSSLATVNSQVTAEQVTLASEQSSLSAGEQARGSYKAALHAVAVLEHAAPLADEVPALIDLINGLEKGHRITWKSVQLSGSGAASAAGLQTLTLNLSFTSSYTDLQNFFAAFDALTRSDAVNILTEGRFATISEVNLGPVGGKVTATVTITVYQTAGSGAGTGSSSTVAVSP